MSWEAWVQSQVESYQRLKKWYLMPPCLILSIIRYGSRVKWSNPGKGVVPSPTPWCSSYQKGSLWVTLDYGHQLYFFTLYIYIYIYGDSLFYQLSYRGVRENATLVPELLHFTLDLYLIMLSVKQGSIKYHFLSL